MHATPYLNFNGNCREAFTLYQQLFGGELMLMRFADAPSDVCDGMPAEVMDKVMHVTLAGRDGPIVMGSDAPPGRGAERTEGIGVALGFDDNAEAERVFGALAEGGQIQMAFGETFWSERFGMVVDRFGVPWMINGKPKALQ